MSQCCGAIPNGGIFECVLCSHRPQRCIHCKGLSTSMKRLNFEKTHDEKQLSSWIKNMSKLKVFTFYLSRWATTLTNVSIL